MADFLPSSLLYISILLPQDVCVIPSLKGSQYFPAHGGIKNANLFQVDTTGMFARSKATQTRWGFHGRGRMTVWLWYSSLQAVDHVGNDRIRKVIQFPTSFENLTREPASCAQQVSAGHSYTQCTKENRRPPCNQHALTLTAAAVDSNRAAGEASLPESKQVEDDCTPWPCAIARVAATSATVHKRQHRKT